MAWTTPGTAVAGDVLTASFWNSNVRDNLNAIGGSWTSWTPSLGNGWANGNATIVATYMLAGKLCIFRSLITIGSTTTKAATTATLTLPVTAAANPSAASFSLVMEDVGTNAHPGFVYDVSTTEVYLSSIYTASTYASIGGLTNTVPFTWTTGDKINFSGFYEAA